MKFFGFSIFLVGLARAQNDAYVRIAARSNSVELTGFVDAIVDFNDANGLRVDDLMTEDSFEEDAENSQLNLFFALSLSEVRNWLISKKKNELL